MTRSDETNRLLRNCRIGFFLYIYEESTYPNRVPPAEYFANIINSFLISK